MTKNFFPIIGFVAVVVLAQVLLVSCRKVDNSVQTHNIIAK